jgi:tight adherence protein B
MMDRLWITAFLVFFAAVFATFSLAALSEFIRGAQRRRQVAKRLKPVLSGRVRRAAGASAEDLVKRDPAEGGLLGITAGYFPSLKGLSGLLEQGRLDWGVGTFLILSLGAAMGSAGFVFMLTNGPFMAAVAGVGGALVPYFYVLLRRRARFRQFEEELPEAIDLLTRAIRAGHPLSSGMQMVADEGPPEVAAEFRRAFEEQRFGIPFDEALMGMVDRTDLVDVRIFAIAVLVQREVGGNLAEILDNLAHTIRRRFYLRRQLRVYTAQGRMTGYALVALPIAVGLIVFVIQPGYIMMLFNNLFGLFLVGTALFLQAVGGLWVRKIIDIEI